MRASASHVRFSDADILQRVVSYLSCKGLDGIHELDIEVHDGIVTLSGYVESSHQRQVAVNSCQRVAGVVHLIDQLHIDADLD